MGDDHSPQQRPTVAVLVRDGDDRPGDMDEVESRANVVYVSGTDELRRALSRAEALFVWDFTSAKVRDAWDGAAPGLRWVHVASTGVDPVLFPGLVESDVTLTNSREIFDAAIAEYVAALVLAQRKDLPHTLELARRHSWVHRETHMVAGQEALVVGAGPIGRAIGRMLAALGCTVRILARTPRNDDPDFGRVHGEGELDTLLPTADVVVAAVPLTSGTRGLFGAQRFARMKPDALFVNVARGQVVDEDALLGALRGGELAGAGLDVFSDEPLPEDHPFWDMPNVIVSPHMSGDFVGWRDALARRFVSNFLRWVAGEPLHDVVDKRLGYVPSSA